MNWVRLGCLLLCPLLLHTEAAEKKLRVVTTFLPAYSFAMNVAGDRAHVENLVPGNVSLHDFQLSPPELKKIVAADLIVINGLGLETFLDRALKNTGTKAQVVTLADGLHAELIHLEHSENERGGGGHNHSHDPHIWLDLSLAAASVTNLSRALQAADPENAEAYQRNARDYVARLEALDAEIAQQLRPLKSAAFVTYHNAFQYFVRRYELNLAGVVEQVPEIAPSIKERGELSRVIRAKQVKVLFTEPGGKSRLAQQIAKDAGLRLGELDPLETGELTADAYEKGMRRNAAALVKGLR